MTTPIYDSVAYLASDRFAVFNAAGDSFASEFAPGARLRADCGTDGVLLGTVAASSFEAATGRTVVTTAMDGGAALTANLAEVLHGNDLPESLCAHAALHAIGGRDALPAASADVSGLISLASAAETQAGTSAAKAVTPAGLVASAKGLIATNTTIFVATTGSDTTGTGASGAPYASIAKALSSIAGKLIASGVIVTIQVADGTYNVSSTITIDHPDADKIQILGNTSAETTVAITAIDTTAKTITVAGNYVSNADATKNIQAGDIVGLTGSSTIGLNGGYVVSGVSYDGTNTVVTCSAETIASSTVGGGVIRILPCQKCVLNVSSGVTPFYVKTQLGMLSGFRINSSGGTAFGMSTDLAYVKYQMTKCIFVGFTRGISLFNGSFGTVSNVIFRNCTIGVYGNLRSTIYYTGYVIHDTCPGNGIYLNRGSWANAFGLLLRGAVISPAADTEGNNKSYICTA
ncbi:MAG: hypothetical protein B193_1576 [Solidesulfovibrio magneticus str. Maddingley MBC34]|uniref:Uncharacterized protein n=1 Tax=Solidesulfovibrio magneticus str. Maddingley MBC34 TaxID=1206767 RepID=K6GRV0_9BACT|nr:MAG: hypothetical protein B193_1576 [Solidesulfovibrio magneticus str. Maddingley MBC34]